MAEELTGPVSLRADLILVCASRIYAEAASLPGSDRLGQATIAERCVKQALMLACEVDRQIAQLRSAQKGTGE